MVSLSLARNGPVDPPRSWVTGEHHRYLHNYLTVALTVPRGKHVEAGTATYRVPIRQHFSGYRWRQVVARRGDVTRRKRIVSLSSVRIFRDDLRAIHAGSAAVPRSSRDLFAARMLARYCARSYRSSVNWRGASNSTFFKRRASPFISFPAKDASLENYARASRSRNVFASDSRTGSVRFVWPSDI